MKIKVKVLKGMREKSVGLIGKDPVYPVFFTTRFGIHTFGMNVPIDVLILDDDYRVVKLARAIPPNRIFCWNPKYQNVMELPAGPMKVSLGDIIEPESDTRLPDPSR